VNSSGDSLKTNINQVKSILAFNDKKIKSSCLVVEKIKDDIKRIIENPQLATVDKKQITHHTKVVIS
jgi:hypothetical protein